jgi:hypothetical protein
MNKAIVSTMAFAAVAVALGVSAGAESKTPIMAGGASMEVGVNNGMLVVDSVEAPADGYVVVHVMMGDKPGEVLGYAPVKTGENKNVEVKLEKLPMAGDKLAIMLHQDTGKMGSYEFGMEGSMEDAPVMAEGKPVMEMVTVK